MNWFYRSVGKRCIDFVVGAALLVTLAPVILVVGLFVRVALGRPVLFRQRRVGRNGKIFPLYKFRSMLETRDEQGDLLPDEQRITKGGRLLRRLSLDELPQLWNVIRGDMSLIGPRPLLVRYLPRYSEHQARRHEIRPGITGWAQVNGRNAISWDERFDLDVYYVDHVSLWLDVRIVWLTVWHVLAGKGISQQDHATMPEFMGSEHQSRN